MARLEYCLSVVALILMAAGPTHGASITAGGTDHLVAGDVDDPHVISVHIENSGYANAFSDISAPAYTNTTTNVVFNGPIVAYRFVNVAGGPGARMLNTVIESGGIIAQMTSTDEADNDGFDSFGQNALDGYAATDPGTNLLTTTAPRDFTAGIRDLDDFSGTVDISGLKEGTIYIFYGRYGGGGLSLTATMIDSVLPNINSGELFNGPSAVINQNIYATRINFEHDTDYDSITYTSDGSRLVGAVVTIPPPPKGTVVTLQ